MVPREVTVEVVRSELPGLEAWSARHDCSVRMDWASLVLQIVAEDWQLRAILEGYRALPPIWTVEDSGGANIIKSLSQSKGPRPEGISSLFHSSGVICAPFSRLAYGEEGGPHKNWGASTGWLSAGSGKVKATTLGDMAQVIWLHLTCARGTP